MGFWTHFSTKVKKFKIRFKKYFSHEPVTNFQSPVNQSLVRPKPQDLLQSQKNIWYRQDSH